MELTDNEIDKWLRAILNTRVTWKGAHLSNKYIVATHSRETKNKKHIVDKSNNLLGTFNTCPLCVMAEDDCRRCIMQVHPDYDATEDMAMCAKIFNRVKAANSIEAAANEALDIVEAELRKL